MSFYCREAGLNDTGRSENVKVPTSLVDVNLTLFMLQVIYHF